MNDQLSRLSKAARQAVRAKDWATVHACAREILKENRKYAEGWFLSGLAEKAAGHTREAVDAFSNALRFDPRRYDAAIELAWQYWVSVRLGEARDLLQKYESQLDKNPLYLGLAAKTYSRLGLHEKAFPLWQKATKLRPGNNRFQENLAACAVFLGEIKYAKAIYQELLIQQPNHQRNHYALSRLERAEDFSHVEQMERVLGTTGLTPRKNIFLYYALAKEYEDLEQWEDAFHYYKLAGDAAGDVARDAGYDVSTDIALIDKIIEVCNANWLASGAGETLAANKGKTPIFIVGLPRTGTTLTERIVSSHSRVESADETTLMHFAIRRAGGVEGGGDMSPAIIKAAAKSDIRFIAKTYLDAIDYKLGDRPLFIDKLPENFLFLGFISRAMPNAKIIHLRRNPMDACFAMYKQSFFRFAYRLEDIGQYYVAYDRLHKHWREVLKNRVIEIEYESLVSDPEAQTRALLDKLGLDFEQACLDFHLNKTSSATASAAQVREKAHTRSVNRWKHFASQLQPLKDALEKAGISVQ